LRSIKSDKREIVYESIGEVKNNFCKPDDPKNIRNSKSQLILNEKYLPALEGIERYKYLLVVYHIDRSPGYRERGCIPWEIRADRSEEYSQLAAPVGLIRLA